MISGIADVASHQVPDLSLIRAHEDPLPFHACEDDLKVAVGSGVGVWIEGMPLSGSSITSVALPASINCQVLPVSSLRQIPPFVPLIAA